ncbi:MAG TPA: preprotein translocase subunit YajC [Candidatus Acidoferrales bacterium]|nr:preprotein translocase subunit YajC [Candidatus Acidoferrales bacterium]
MINLFLALMAPQGGDGGGSMISTLLMFGLIIVIFYFMIIRPQSKRQKERQKMLEAMKKGDKVVTSGGIHGKIIAMEDKTVLLEIADNIKVKVEKSAVSAVVPE